MIVQLSSGMGPYECELAVTGIFNALKKEFPDIHEYANHKSRKNNVGCTSILFTTNEDLSFLEGTIQWICESPVRPHHKRKNWFIDVSIIKEKEGICKDKDIKFRTFKCGGPGGQHVNKTESGVEAIHIPTGLRAISRDERSQHQNKQKALEKLNALIQWKEQENERRQNKEAWAEHAKIVRGNPVRIYTGKNFRLTLGGVVK